MNDLTGQTIDRYHILEQIGEGGMAVVYKAYDTRLEREVAIKIIRKEAFPAETYDHIFKRFEREAKALAKLSHPNIIKVYDYGEFDGSPYLVMEYQPGGTLKAVLGKPLSWQDCIKYVLPIAQALAYAHQLGIIHRDIKPSNILISNNGLPMLSDFGIAKLLESDGKYTLTGTGVGIGTPEYMAPEQGLGKSVDARADIYALGVVLYELVTGRTPYQAETPMAVIIAHISDSLPNPREYIKDIPKEVELLLLKSMAKAPENRYQNMNELAIAMGKVTWGYKDHRIQENSSRTPKVDHTDNTIDELVTPRVVSKPHGRQQRKQIPKNIWVWISVTIFVLIVGMILVKQVSNKPLQATQIPTGMVSTAQVITSNTQSVVNTSIPTKTLQPSPTIMLAPTQWVGLIQTSPKDDMVMVFVPEGDFIMGSDKGFAYERPVHTVYLDAFWIDRTEVTNAMYQQCVATGECTENRGYGSNFNGDQQPVVGVDWNQANAYCEWAGRELPSEAQWEKAARGDDGRTYPWGEGADTNNGNYGQNVGRTIDVGSYPDGVSPYGVLDMAGNVWEWVADWYDDNYYALSPNNNPMGPDEGEYRVFRGGAWNFNAYNSRSANRSRNFPSYSNFVVGFRCVNRESVTP